MINWSKTKISIARAIIEQGSGPKGPMSCRKQGGISRRPSVRPSWGGIFQLLDGRFRPLGAYLKGRCEVWRVDLRHGGGKFKAKRADLRPWGLNWGLGGLIWGLGGLISGPEGLIWGPGGMIWGPGELIWSLDAQWGRRTDGRKDGRTDGRMDGRTAGLA